jgi:hypothetical protein
MYASAPFLRHLNSSPIAKQQTAKNLQRFERGRENLSAKDNNNQKEDQYELQFLSVYGLGRIPLDKPVISSP